MDAAKKGATALGEGNYQAAIDAYTNALKSSPTAPDYYIKRSTAYQRLSPSNHVAALKDAEQAVLCAQIRAKRELIVQGQLRRAIALFGLDRYGDANLIFEVVKRMDPKEKSLSLWEGKLKSKMEAIKNPEDVKLRVTVEETPSLKTSEDEETNPPKATESSVTDTDAISSSFVQATTQTPADKIRHEWYQNNDNVIISLMAKGVPKDGTSVEIQADSVSISTPLNTGSNYEFSLEPLFASVTPSLSDYKIMSTKVEIILRKAQSGIKWKALERTEPNVVGNAVTPSANIQQSNTSITDGPPNAYVSKSGPKNWDKVVNDITSKKSGKDGDNTKNGGDNDNYDYEVEDGDPTNAFFKKLYAGASPEVQRAMMKSFTESNGTALSTNWAEVGSKAVETQPPSGMEAKKW